MTSAIAMVSLACRLPGAVVPSRWDGLAAPSHGLLADVELFDAGFFGMSFSAAQALDPRRRLLLEVASEALSGVDRRGRIGVFGGDARWLAGELGLTGPVGVGAPMGLAMAALRAGSCDLALACDVTVFDTPGPWPALPENCWAAVLGRSGVRASRGRVPEFRRERYWFTVGLPPVGLTPPHPWLVTAALVDEGYVFYGRVPSTGEVVPAAALLDVVLHAARQAGAAAVEELTLTDPLVLPERGQTRLKITVGPLAIDGRRALTVHSQRESMADWQEHATGTLTDDPAFAEGTPAAAGDGGCSACAGRGAGPGGDDGCGGGSFEIALDPIGGQRGVGLVAAALGLLAPDAGVVPAQWRGVELPVAISSARLVRVDRRAGRVWFLDAAGVVVGYVHHVCLAVVSPGAVRAREPVEHLCRVGYRPFVAEGRGEPARRVVVDLVGRELGGDPAVVARRVVLEVLAGLRGPLVEADGAELVVVVPSGLVCAPVAGLVRSLRAEYPRSTVRLVEVREGAAPLIVEAVAATGVAELLVDRELLVPELQLVPARRGVSPLGVGGAVLVTGGTGELGRVVARHLVVEHGVRHVYLVSRRGPDAPGADERVAELLAAGADTVRIFAADVADRSQVVALLSEVDRPLTAVFHLAGVVDDRLVAGQDAVRFDRALAPKVAGAWQLHELTRGQPLAAFVLFSSIAGVSGAAGQSNYAAANAFLDALAHHRRGLGLVATSLSWGLWEQSDTGMSAHLGAAELARLRRHGIAPLSVSEGLAALDAALSLGLPHLVPVRRTPPVVDEPAPLGGGAVLALVQREVAAVLGESVGVRQGLADAGMDSLMAVELRARIAVAVGVSLPADLVFEHPTPGAIARFVVSLLAAEPAAPEAVVVVGAARGPDGVWAALERAGLPPDSLRGTDTGVFLVGRDWDLAAEVASMFGFCGPAVTVLSAPDVAVHLARVALLRGECVRAIAGAADDVLVLARSSTVDHPRAVVDSAYSRVVIEPVPVRARRVLDRECGPLPVVVSGRDHTALRLQAARWADWLAAHPDVPLADLARTAALHRTHFVARASVLARTTSGAAAALRALANGVPHTDVVEARARPLRRLVFRCADVGGQWVGMGRALLAESTAFARAATACEEVLRPLTGWSVLDVLAGDNELDVDRVEVARPALFTLQVSLAASLRRLGLVPDGVVGVGAAVRVVAGSLSIEDGARLVADSDVLAGPAGDVTVELSPHPSPVSEKDGVVVGTLVRGCGGVAQLMRTVGSLHAHGFAVDWGRVLPPGELVDLPAYVFRPVPARETPAMPADPAGALRWATELAGTELGLLDEV